MPPIAPQRGQIFALDQSSVGIAHVLLTPGDPYFVPRADGRLVIGATREEAGWDPSLTAGGVAWLLNRAIASRAGAQRTAPSPRCGRASVRRQPTACR